MTLIAAEKKSFSSFAVTIDDTVNYCGRSRRKKEEGEEGKDSVVPAGDIHKSFSMRYERKPGSEKG
jgi:hypothetical protein